MYRRVTLYVCMLGLYIHVCFHAHFCILPLHVKYGLMSFIYIYIYIYICR